MVAIVGTANRPPMLVNVGTGTAIDIEWRIPNSVYCGAISYLEAGAKFQLLGLGSMGSICKAGEINEGPEPPQIRCGYSSISGELYRSSSVFDVDDDRFTTTFEHGSNIRTV